MQIDLESFLEFRLQYKNHTELAALLNAKEFKTSKGKAWTWRSSWEFLRRHTHPADLNGVSYASPLYIERLVYLLSEKHTSKKVISLLLHLRGYSRVDGKPYQELEVLTLLSRARYFLGEQIKPPCYNNQWLEADYTNYYRRQEYPLKSIADGYPAPKGNEQLVGTPFFDVCAKTNTLI